MNTIASAVACPSRAILTRLRNAAIVGAKVGINPEDPGSRRRCVNTPAGFVGSPMLELISRLNDAPLADSTVVTQLHR